MQTKMKWWGWGFENVRFDLEKRPGAFDYFKDKLGVELKHFENKWDIEKIKIPKTNCTEEIISAFISKLGSPKVSTLNAERIYHSVGKSYLDLIDIRSGKIKSVTDIVLFPNCKNDIKNILTLASKHNVALVPFGGGSSVVGGVTPLKGDAACVATINLINFNRLIEIDQESMVANFEAGIFGPKLEEELKKYGFMLGHYPQSFEFSTLGGWIASRSCGQNSLKYGGIEKMVESLELMFPGGNVSTIAVPRKAEGPCINEIIIGSEGVFGIITSARVKIQRVPAYQDYFCYVFDGFNTAQNACRELIQKDIIPAMIRISDAEETLAMFKLKKRHPGKINNFVSILGKKFLTLRGFDTKKLSMVFIGVEGGVKDCRYKKKIILKSLSKFKCAYLGSSPGKSWLKERFFLPYLRDDLLDNMILVETLESATNWKNLNNLYKAVGDVLKTEAKKTASNIILLTHVSHIYRDGASLYFSILAQQGKDTHAQWKSIKEAVNIAITGAGGVISHHHGVGVDHKKHLSWSKEVREMFLGVKNSFDKKGIMNPGKIF